MLNSFFFLFFTTTEKLNPSISFITISTMYTLLSKIKRVHVAVDNVSYPRIK